MKYIKSYSPYDNIKKQSYPHIYVTTAYHDSQVQYWEPLKWVAKLREYNTGNSIIALKLLKAASPRLVYSIARIPARYSAFTISLLTSTSGLKYNGSMPCAFIASVIFITLDI